VHGDGVGLGCFYYWKQSTFVGHQLEDVVDVVKDCMKLSH